MVVSVWFFQAAHCFKYLLLQASIVPDSCELGEGGVKEAGVQDALLW